MDPAPRGARGCIHCDEGKPRQHPHLCDRRLRELDKTKRDARRQPPFTGLPWVNVNWHDLYSSVLAHLEAS